MNKKNILSLFILMTVVMVFAMPLFTYAQGGKTLPNPPAGGTTQPPPAPIKMNIQIDNPFKKSTIKDLIETIVNDILIPIGAVVAVLMIIYAGFLFVTARGNETQITKARQALLWAVIGAAILLGAWVISQAITTTIDQLKK